MAALPSPYAFVPDFTEHPASPQHQPIMKRGKKGMLKARWRELGSQLGKPYRHSLCLTANGCELGVAPGLLRAGSVCQLPSMPLNACSYLSWSVHELHFVMAV
mmetsp:Transcript_1980/g.5309  ORF Transcript_1980/g.5309 Transcript_1980/m.5309 type:complete len:103 (+) Transcript_1980:263-571(+)